MIRSLGFGRALLAGVAAVVSAFSLDVQVRAGFTPEELASFEVTHLRGVVSEVLPEEKVIEVIDPEGHREIVTVGIDLKPLGLQKGDNSNKCCLSSYCR